MKFQNILILAGGTSSRFEPLSHKMLFSYNGKPLVEHQIKIYQTFAENVVVVCNEGTHSAIEPLVAKYKAQLAIQKDTSTGMAGGVMAAADMLKGESLIVNGNDLYHSELLAQIYEKAQDKLNSVILAATKVDDYFPGGYLRMGDSGQVAGIEEKPGKSNMPTKYFKLVVDYFQNIEEFTKSIKATSTKKDDHYEVALSSLLEKNNDGAFVVYKKDWATLKYPWHVLDAKNFFLKTIEPYIGNDVEIDSTARIIGDVYIDDGVKIYEYSKIVGPCYIGKNTIIGNYALVLQSMIGEKSVVGGYSEITRSYVGDNVWMHRAYIGDSVIEGEANFAAGSITANYRFDKDIVMVRVKGSKISTNRNKMGLIAGRNIQLGVHATTMPGVKLSSNTLIMPGDVCKKDT